MLHVWCYIDIMLYGIIFCDDYSITKLSKYKVKRSVGNILLDKNDWKRNIIIAVFFLKKFK